MLQTLAPRWGRRLLTLPCVYMAIIFALSQVPGNKLPNWDIQMISLGNFLHFPVYFGLGLLWLLTLDAWPVSARRSIVLSITLATAFGILDELHQYFVPLRSLDPWDVVVNFAGASTAALTWGWIRPLFFGPSQRHAG